MKVLLAVDGSAYTERMLAYIAAHDELLKGDVEFTLLTVVPGIPPHAARFLPALDLQGYYESEAEAVLKPIRAYVAQQGWRAEFRHGHGVPALLRDVGAHRLEHRLGLGLVVAVEVRLGQETRRVRRNARHDGQQRELDVALQQLVVGAYVRQHTLSVGAAIDRQQYFHCVSPGAPAGALRHARAAAGRRV